MPFAIHARSLHWLPKQPPPTDLCAHGYVAVTDGIASLITESSADLALSTGALHLLRALEQDHTPEAPLAEHLIPCCGHWMVLPTADSEVVNVGCPNGVNWWVRHGDGQVVLTFQNSTLALSEDEWRRAVVAFSAEVMALYAQSEPKSPAEDDQDWFPTFLDEWHRRHARALAAG